MQPGPRPFAPGDLDALAALQAAAFPDEVWGRDALAALTNLSTTRALVIDEGAPGMGLAAFLLLQVVPPEAEILSLGVKPARRREGLAAGLLAAAFGLIASQGVRKIFLEVAEDNAPALGLYKALGFSATGRRQAYYMKAGKTSDALLLERPVCAEKYFQA